LQGSENGRVVTIDNEGDKTSFFRIQFKKTTFYFSMEAYEQEFAIGTKLCINHWKVLYKLCVFYVDRNSKMTTTAGHSFYIGSFYDQVNDTGS
jgi:hypothetical protein